MSKSLNIFLLIVFVVLSGFSCKEGSAVPVAQPAAADPYERWNSNNLHDYTIDQVRSCFCIEGGQKMRITVRSDTVVQVVRLSDGIEVHYSRAAFYLTVDSLFGIIRHSTADSLSITYNSQYGYPEKLDVDPQLHPVDGGVLYETSNLQIP